MSEFNNKIIIIDKVLTLVDCQELIQYYKIFKHTHEWCGTFPMSIDNDNIFLMEKIFKVEKNISNFFIGKIKTDWSEIVKWPVGSYKLNHFDTASNRTVFTSITYLNENYCGGETYIVNDVKIIPKIGRTVLFDGNYYEHGVTEIKKNNRYTLTSWYKIDQ